MLRLDRPRRVRERGIVFAAYTGALALCRRVLEEAVVIAVDPLQLGRERAFGVRAQALDARLQLPLQVIHHELDELQHRARRRESTVRRRGLAAAWSCRALDVAAAAGDRLGHYPASHQIQVCALQ